MYIVMADESVKVAIPEYHGTACHIKAGFQFLKSLWLVAINPFGCQKPA